MSGPELQSLDEFTSLLVVDDTRVLVDLLKLSVCGRAGDKGRDVLSAVLSGMGTAYPQVSCRGVGWRRCSRLVLQGILVKMSPFSAICAELLLSLPYNIVLIF